MNRFQLRVLLALSCCLSACATVSTPTGGPRDERPPEMISTTVPTGTVNFRDKAIVVEFNEYIKLQNPAQNIISSPPLGASVGYVARKNKLFITFSDSLAANTTYHLNFGNSIQDVNEGNALNNFQIVFATGPFIDSLSMSGKLIPAGDATISATTLVGLYRDLTDSAFARQAPFYFTFANKDGTFNLKYLKHGTYHVVALTDANNNFYYDLPNESIGFLDSLLAMDRAVSGLEIPLFFSENANLRIKSFKNAVVEHQVVYELTNSLPAGKPFAVYLLHDSLSVMAVTQISEDRTKITAWIDTATIRTQSFQAVLEIEGILKDTLQHTISQRKKPKASASLSPLEIAASDTLILTLNVPVGKVCENMAVIDSLGRDTLRLYMTKTTDFQVFMRPEKSFEENYVYTLLRPDSCVVTQLGQFPEITPATIRILPADAFGSLMLRFENLQPDMDYLVDLLNEKAQRHSSVKISSDKPTWLLPTLKPGIYSLRVTEDANRNGVWNSGTYWPRRYPEKIYSPPVQLTVRPNWEVEESIILGAP